MRSALRVSGGALVLLCLLEAVFRILPVSTSTLAGYHVHPDIYAYPPGHRFTVSSGWNLSSPVRHVANSHGFIADKPFGESDDAVALIGDSFIEASMLPVEQTVGAALQALLGERVPVFAMGGPGSSLLDYAARARWAVETFGVRRVVIVLERHDVRQALCGSGAVHAHCIDGETLQATVRRRADPTFATRILRESALAQYLVSQIKVQPGRLLSRFSQRPEAGDAPAPTGDALEPQRPGRAAMQAEAIIARFHEMLPAGIQVILVADSSHHKRGEPVLRDKWLESLLESARARGYGTVDLSEAFLAFTAETELELSISPADRHWNRFATRIVAREIARAIGGERAAGGS